MSKEKISLDRTALFGDMSPEDIRNAAIKKPGRHRNEELVRTAGAQQGLPVELTRQTLIVPVDQMEILKNYAYTERRRLKSVVQEAFTEYIEKHVDVDNLLIRPDDWR